MQMAGSLPGHDEGANRHARADPRICGSLAGSWSGQTLPARWDHPLV